MFKVTVDKDTCTGCGVCEGTCDNFKMGDDGKAEVVKAEVEEAGCNKDAEEACPVDAIKVQEV